MAINIKEDSSTGCFTDRGNFNGRTALFTRVNLRITGLKVSVATGGLTEVHIKGK